MPPKWNGSLWLRTAWSALGRFARIARGAFGRLVRTSYLGLHNALSALGRFAVSAWYWCTRVLCEPAMLTALATIVLAVATVAYLLEVQAQRDLVYQQLRLANEPAVQVNPPTWNRSSEQLILKTFIHNFGGRANALATVYVLLCCGEIQELVKRPEQLKWEYWSGGGSAIHRGQFHASENDLSKHRAWLTPALEQNRQVHVLVVARFQAPALTLADSPRAEMVADAFHWNMPHGAFGAYAERGYQMAREIALAKLEGYAEPEVVDLVRRADHGDFAETLYPLQPNK